MKVEHLALLSLALVFVWLGGAGSRASVGSHAAAETMVTPAAYAAQYERVTLVFPSGDRDDGRQAFLDLKCTVCHHVASEPDFPEPFTANPGPVLDQILATRPTRYLAEAIISPSHSMSINTSDEVKVQMDGVLSPMADYSRAMSVRQMIDLLAYLRGISE